jgi:hypothetical protein
MTNIGVGFGPGLNLEAIIEVIRTAIGTDVMKGTTVIIVLSVSIMRVSIMKEITTKIIMMRIIRTKTETSTKFP